MCFDFMDLYEWKWLLFLSLVTHLVVFSCLSPAFLCDQQDITLSTYHCVMNLVKYHFLKISLLIQAQFFLYLTERQIKFVLVLFLSHESWYWYILYYILYIYDIEFDILLALPSQYCMSLDLPLFLSSRRHSRSIILDLDITEIDTNADQKMVGVHTHPNSKILKGA